MDFDAAHMSIMTSPLDTLFWKNLTLFDGLVSVRASVRAHLGNFYESMYIHIYGSQRSSWGVANDFF